MKQHRYVLILYFECTSRQSLQTLFWSCGLRKFAIT